MLAGGKDGGNRFAWSCFRGATRPGQGPAYGSFMRLRLAAKLWCAGWGPGTQPAETGGAVLGPWAATFSCASPIQWQWSTLISSPFGVGAQPGPKSHKPNWALMYWHALGHTLAKLIGLCMKLGLLLFAMHWTAPYWGLGCERPVVELLGLFLGGCGSGYSVQRDNLVGVSGGCEACWLHATLVVVHIPVQASTLGPDMGGPGS